jgi:hypothetical protein
MIPSVASEIVTPEVLAVVIIGTLGMVAPLEAAWLG